MKTWEEIMDKAREVQEGYKNRRPEEYAQLLQDHLKDEPLLGWLLLANLQGEMPREQRKEGNG